MTTKHFDAITAKNDIAREVRNCIQLHEDMNPNFVLACLKEIEAYIGQANQPSVTDIVETTKYEL